MKVFVTGGAGFIGCAVARHLLLDRGDEVLVYDKLTYAGNQSSLRDLVDHSRFKFVRGCVCDAEALDAVMTRFEPDAVVHLAAESHVDRSITGAAEFINTNILGTFRLLEAARAYLDNRPSVRESFRFLHVSTDEVYGSLGVEGLFTETTPYDPRSPYSASKAASDHLASAWWHTYGLPVLISNCSNNYGPYQLPEKLVPLMILNALAGRDLPIYGDGKNVRDWLYVDDHARALALILDRGVVGETYNIGGRNERTNLQVVETICREIDKRGVLPESRMNLLKFVADRPGHDRRYAIDASKLETDLGWRAKETFETGLSATIDWYLANDWWWRSLRADGHGLERLGLLPK